MVRASADHGGRSGMGKRVRTEGARPNAEVREVDALAVVGDALGVTAEWRVIVYGGERTIETKRGIVLSYRDLGMLELYESATQWRRCM